MSVSIYAGNFNKDNNVKETSINYKENVSNRTNGVNGIFNGVVMSEGQDNSRLADNTYESLLKEADDVKQQIQQEFRGNAVSRQQQAARDEEGKHAVDGRRIEEHRHPQLFRVGNDPLFIFVDRRLELFERKHGLTERLDDRNAADIFHGLAGHGGKGIAVLAHFSPPCACRSWPT